MPDSSNFSFRLVTSDHGLVNFKHVIEENMKTMCYAIHCIQATDNYYNVKFIMVKEN